MCKDCEAKMRCKRIPQWEGVTNPIWDDDLLDGRYLMPYQVAWIKWNRNTEYRWLRKSLKAEGAEDWLINLVIKRWPDARKDDPYFEDPKGPDAYQAYTFCETFWHCRIQDGSQPT